MNQCHSLVAVALLALACGACAQRPSPSERAESEPTVAPATEGSASVTASSLLGPGWTGLTEPEELIEARRLLMQELERQIAPLDQFTIGRAAELDALRAAAVTMEPMLLAFPHLFPPTTNLYDPSQLESPTIALPAIWENFERFQQIAADTEEAAVAIAQAATPGELRAAARGLRARCDACHASFTRAYTPPKFLPEDYEFDFDSALPDA